MRTISMPRSIRRPVVEQILFSALFGTLLFLAVIVIFLVGFQLRYLGAIYPGVNVAGLDVGGLSIEAASARITQEFTYPQQGRILLRYQDQTWLVTPSQLGLFLDPETTAKRAYAVGRSQDLFTNLKRQFEASYYSHSIAPTLIFDQRMAQNYLSSLAGQLNVAVVEPSLRIEGVEVVVQNGQVGRYLDVPATLVAISDQIGRLQDGIVDLNVVDVRPVVSDVSGQAELARAILSQDFTLNMPDGQPDQKGPWVFSPQDLAKMLVFERVEDHDQARYELALDSGSLRAYLESLSDSLEVSPQNTRFMFNDDTRQLEVIQPAVIGRVLDIESSIAAIQDGVVNKKHSAGLEFTFTPPSVTDEMTGEDLGITELLHEEISYFRGSDADRIQNIQAASSRFHGLLVPPGASFSMASALGDISLENGYAEALIIVGDQTVQGVGGGVCQVSTTLFRSVFFSGFPVLERHSHAYRVYYYEQDAAGHDSRLAGLDATVFVPLVDFKFVNDSPHWLLMETYVNPTYSTLVWKFYSTKDGRSVEWQTTGPTNIVEAPEPQYKENPELTSGEVKKVDYSADGADITVNRTVMKDGSVYFQDTFNTHYEPWQEKWEYGPGTEGMPPEDNGDEDEG